MPSLELATFGYHDAMVRNPGCWANVLDDCDGVLSAEHTISVAVWAGVGERQNRKSRLGRSITVTTPTGTRQTSVRRLTRNILCEWHNNGSNDLDTEAGRFARALDRFIATDEERARMPGFNWAPRTFEVDGPLLERWFLKSAINASFGNALPIGSSGGQPGWPTRELVEMVFGRREVAKPFGLFAVVNVGNTHILEEAFEFIPFDRNGTHIAGHLLVFRSFHFGVSFEARQVRDDFFQALPGLKGAAVLQPVRMMKSGGTTNVQLRINWPA